MAVPSCKGPMNVDNVIEFLTTNAGVAFEGPDSGPEYDLQAAEVRVHNVLHPPKEEETHA